MEVFRKAFRRGCEACGLRGQRVLVGVSGGADSVALLRGLLELIEELYLTLAVAHLNHGLRGSESDADAAWVAQICEEKGVRCIVGQTDVAQLARERGDGIEEAARRARYDFLTHAAEETLSSHIAVGHTADDQAETILHHILRGTGLTGLKGMPPVRTLKSGKQLARPMLGIHRTEVISYLGEIQQVFREDSSNVQDDYTRNRVRQKLIPLLQRDFNPQVREALLRLGDQAGEQQAVIDTLAKELLERALSDRTPTLCRLRWGELQAQPRHLVRACLMELWRRQNWPRQRMGFAEWDRVAEIAIIGGSASLPGKIHARRRAGLLVLERR